MIFEPLDLVARLAALVPPPRFHLVRYSGVLAPSAGWRPLVVPHEPEAAGAPPHAGCTAGRETLHRQAQQQGSSRGRNYSWAQLMRRVFAVDVLECPECHGPMRILSAIHTTEAIQRILDCLSLPSRAPPIAPALPEREMHEPYLC